MLRTLATTDQIESARRELMNRGLSCIRNDNLFVRLLRRCGVPLAPPVGHGLKSWDVLKTAEFLEARLSREDAVLDLGAFSSEMLLILQRMGFSNLVGADRNPRIVRMPLAGQIHWLEADFLTLQLAEGSFAAITAISVIEHGYNPDILFAQISRLLRPGGLFVCSFDYWPVKIFTRQLLFDLSWTIFSKEEVLAMIRTAALHGLDPDGDLDLEVGGVPPISWEGHRYTFAWLALRKRESS